ncbi:MAG: PqqD family protein [Reyranellaceae bacterium]
MDLGSNAKIERALAPPEVAVGDEEIVLLDIAGGIYYTLTGAVSIRIWQSTAAPLTLETLVDQLVDEFEIDRQTCAEQTADFLHRLLSRGLLRLVPGA